MLEKKEIRRGMSRKSNCLDNAAIENFSGLLKANSSTCKISSPWNTLSRNYVLTWITTTTTVSRQS